MAAKRKMLFTFFPDDFYARQWDRFWLPGNSTWKEISGPEYPNYYDLFTYSLPIAFGMLVLRQIIDGVIFRKIGQSLDIPDENELPDLGLPRHIEELLEAYYLSVQNSGSKIDPKSAAVETALKSGVSNQTLRKWFKLRKRKDKPSKLVRFQEHGFHFTIYTSFVLYGLWTLWDKEYIELYDVDYTGYPYHTQARDVQWWYFLETGFYISALITMFRWQHRRRDFTMLVVHHCVTLSSLWVSWTMNLLRGGAWVLAVHDVSDIFLESAKLLEISGRLPVLFSIQSAGFLVVWVYTRCYMFIGMGLPFTYGSLAKIGDPPAYPAFYLNNAVVTVIGVLNFLWTFFLCSMVYRKVTQGGAVKDTRSEDEASSSEVADRADDARAKVE